MDTGISKPYFYESNVQADPVDVWWKSKGKKDVDAYHRVKEDVDTVKFGMGSWGKEALDPSQRPKMPPSYIPKETVTFQESVKVDNSTSAYNTNPKLNTLNTASFKTAQEENIYINTDKIVLNKNDKNISPKNIDEKHVNKGKPDSQRSNKSDDKNKK